MKRCPHCNRVEPDEALAFCRVDGTPLVRESGTVGEGAGTLRFGSAPATGETQTRVLPTGEALHRPTAPTTLLDERRPYGSTRESGGPKSRKLAAVAAAAVFIAAVTAAALFYLSRGGGNAGGSVAVLPFENAGGDPDVEYLSDGLTEGLINSLSRLSNVRVLARSTMFRFKGQDPDPQEVGRRLGVDVVLTGRVAQRGDSLTVQTELVKVSDGSQVWGEQFNRRLADIAALQGEIVRAVSHELRVKLSGADERELARDYTANAEAYRLYLEGRFYWNRRTVSDFKRSIESFQQAIRLEPNYAPAYTGLADAYALLAVYDGAPARELMPKAKEAALKALSLDDGLAEAHASLGQVLHSYEYDFDGAEREYRRAIELNPNYAPAHQWYGELLACLGRSEESLARMRRALEIDPFSLVINRMYGAVLLYARQYDASIVQQKKTIELDVNWQGGHHDLAVAYQLKGSYAESVEVFARWRELYGDPQGAALAREAYAKGGWQGFLRAMTDPRRPQNLNVYRVATFYVELGDKDRAIKLLNEAYDIRENDLYWMKVDPRLDPLRPDPRFADLVRKVGLPQ